MQLANIRAITYLISDLPSTVEEKLLSKIYTIKYKTHLKQLKCTWKMCQFKQCSVKFCDNLRGEAEQGSGVDMFVPMTTIRS